MFTHTEVRQVNMLWEDADIDYVSSIISALHKDKRLIQMKNSRIHLYFHVMLRFISNDISYSNNGNNFFIAKLAAGAHIR